MRMHGQMPDNARCMGDRGYRKDTLCPIMRYAWVMPDNARCMGDQGYRKDTSYMIYQSLIMRNAWATRMVPHINAYNAKCMGDA
jgi:hypothetical protein